MEQLFTPAEERLLRDCAWHVFRKGAAGLGIDDLVQEGRIALWLAKIQGRVPEESVHASRYKRQRVRGAMVDSADTAFRLRHKNMVSLDDEDRPVELDGDYPDPSDGIRIRQLISTFMRRSNHQQQRWLALALEEKAGPEIADELGVTESRVSQIRKSAKALIAREW